MVKLTAIRNKPTGLYWMTADNTQIQVNTGFVIMAEPDNGGSVIYLRGMVDELGRAKPIRIREKLADLYDRPVFVNEQSPR